MNNKRWLELVKLQVAHANQLTMMGKMHMSIISASVSLLKLNEEGEIEEFSNIDRKSYYDDIYSSINSYLDVMEVNMKAMRKIYAEILELSEKND